MASLFEQYEKLLSSSNTSKLDYKQDNLNNADFINLRSNVDEPIFSKNKINFEPPTSITHMAVSNNHLVIAMANKTVKKIDLLNSSKPTEIDLNLSLPDKGRQSDLSNIFLDPTGKHCLFSFVTKNSDMVAFENVYYNKKVCLLTKMKGHVITAIGWNPSSIQQALASTALNTSNSNTGNILVGTSDGRLFETQLQPDDKFLSSKELFWKPVYDLFNACSLVESTKSSNSTNSGKEQICAINFFQLQDSSTSNNQYCVLIATRNFLYQFTGSASFVDGNPYLYQIFANPNNKTYKEMPGYLCYSKLDLFYTGLFPKSFGWLTEPGIFYGEIPQDLSVDNDNRVFDNASLLMYNDIKQSDITGTTNLFSNAMSDETPISFVLTRFHLLLLYPSSLKIICVLNQQVIMEDTFLENCGRLGGILKDPIRGTIWLHTERSVYRYKVVQEDRNIWEIYLKQKDFFKARHYAGDDIFKLDRTICEEAMHHFNNGDYKKSAQLFATTRSKSFEEIALKFIELKDKDQEGLKEFLLYKLGTLSAIKDRTQIIILLLWLYEIMLNQLASINNTTQDANLTPEDIRILKTDYNRIESNLKDLMSNSNYKACNKKNRQIIYNLIRNHANQDMLVYFAEQVDDFECLIDHYLQSSQCERALTILRKEECLDLYYRYAPVIVKQLPAQLITQLIPLASQINFAKLIPALVHFDHANDHESKMDTKREIQCTEILRFLEFCVFNLHTSNSLVHNYLIALYAQYQPDKLLTYLELKGQDPESLPYDLRYAARICSQLGTLPQATVHLLATMGAYEEAVEQALASNDVELAKKIAEKSRQATLHRSDMSKRLWLKIAKFEIKNISFSNNSEGGDDINSKNQFNLKATSILNECSLLKIEDILPYFPEFLTIDHFKDDICKSLKEYNQNIESLREDMRSATESAQEIREEINNLRNRFKLISTSDRCSVCGGALMMGSFYSFYCGHLFHSRCLLLEIKPFLAPKVAKKVGEMDEFLRKTKPGQIDIEESKDGTKIKSSIDNVNNVDEIGGQLDEVLADECIYCSDRQISIIDEPFISPNEVHELKGWD